VKREELESTTRCQSLQCQARPDNHPATGRNPSLPNCCEYALLTAYTIRHILGVY